MVVGVVRLTLHIPENDSLKSKRRVVKQIIERTRNRFDIAIAETDLQDSHRETELGLACVGNDRRVVNSVLDRAIGYIDSLGTAIITGNVLEIINI
jgi:uncharacterized protein YlxP (DUF503 family)